MITKYANPLNINIIFITDGIFIQAYHVKDEDFLYYNSEIVTEFLSEKKLKLFVEGDSKIFSEKKVVHSKVELIKIFQEANDILRKDGLSEGKERFTEFSNLLFLKLISDIEDLCKENGEKRRLEKTIVGIHIMTRTHRNYSNISINLYYPDLTRNTITQVIFLTHVY